MSKNSDEKREKRKILLSGVKPTGRPHIGNYFGAMKQFVDLQNEHDCFIFIADLHALTSLQNREEMSQAILDVAIDYLAIGLDPEKVTLFKQSDIQEHAELTWIFNCITTMPYLMRAHAFKDAEAKNKEINVGLFDYPMLMAADILLYDSNIVPVGQDQKQHIEIARDTAEKFNRIFGDTFILPDALIMEQVAIVPGIDGKKMSKSHNNTIPLFANDDEIRKLVMGIVTDSNESLPQNVYNIHKLIQPEEKIKQLYESKKGRYKELKEDLASDLQAFLRPLREKRNKISADTVYIKNVLNLGGGRAKMIAREKMKLVRKAVGIA